MLWSERCLEWALLLIISTLMPTGLSEPSQTPFTISGYGATAAPGSDNKATWTNVTAGPFKKCDIDTWPYFYCSNGNCFSYQDVCDGHDDCGDSHDECGAMCHQTFRCVASKKCLALDKFCDGVIDCEDGSDEWPPTTGFVCSNSWLTVLEDNSGTHWKERRVPYNSNATRLLLEKNVTSRTCQLPQKYVCDGINHCGDHSDECSEKCVSQNESFACNNGRCVSIRSTCDKRDDCGDASDETHDSCLKYFSCYDGHRIAFSKFCDGNPDCPDGSDEIRPEALDPSSNDTISCSNINNFYDDRCVLPSEYYCDGTEQCVDREDECGPSCSFSFLCDNGQCLVVGKKCDGRGDCDDLSDECGDFGCDKTLHCKNGTCLSLDRFCDGIEHCADGEDEIEQSGKDDGFHYCPNMFGSISSMQGLTVPKRQCRLPSEYLCDGVEHCPGRSDECGKNCQHSFFCDEGETCVPRSELCNGIESCNDKKDEQVSLTSTRGFKCHVPFGHSSHGCVLPQEFIGDQIRECVDQSDRCYEEVDGTNISTCVGCRTQPNIRISQKQLCDGIFDCPDFSDECFCFDVRAARICSSFCPTSNAPDCPCAVGMVPCFANTTTVDDSPQCIPSGKFCDGIPRDCENGADEMFCEPVTSGKSNKDPPTTSPIRCKKSQPGNPYAPEYATACDFVPECADMEDECDYPCQHDEPEFCKYRSADGFFSCSSIKPGKLVCDGLAHCPGLEDEIHCNETRRTCQSGDVYSVPHKQWCDFRPDCEDSSDEIELYCNESHFYCEHDKTLFVRKRQMFDGKQDCLDGSDECPKDWQDTSIFSSREHLIKSVFLQVMIWIMGLLAVGGNISVITQSLKLLCSSKRRKLNKVAVIYKVLVLNLAVADLLMGAFLLTLGVENARTSGHYCQQDHMWRSGFACSCLGVLAVLSSEVSLITLAILSTYRSYCVVKPVKSRTLNVHTTILVLTAAWLFGFIVAFLPFSYSLQNYFVSEVWISPNPFFGSVVDKGNFSRFHHVFSHYLNRSYSGADGTVEWKYAAEMFYRFNPNYKVLGLFGYYSTHATCLPKIFVTRQDTGWEYSLALTIFNFLLCFYIVAAYCLICRPRQINKTSVMNQGTRKMQRKIAILVASDCTCWLPICFIAFLWFGGAQISSIVYAVTAIILLPINSALNPLFYSDAVQSLCKELKGYLTKACIGNAQCHALHGTDPSNRGKAKRCSTGDCDTRLLETGDGALSAVYRSESRMHTEHTFVESTMAESVI